MTLSVLLQIYTFVAHSTEYMGRKFARIDHTPAIQFEILPASGFQRIVIGKLRLLVHCIAFTNQLFRLHGPWLDATRKWFGVPNTSVSTPHLEQM